MTKKIRILHILPNLNRGGAERIACDLLLKFDRRQFEPGLLLFKEEGGGEQWKKELIASGVEIMEIKKSGLIDIRNFLGIISAIKNFHPDIIHTHLGGDIYGRLAAKLAGIKRIVSTEHNLNVNEAAYAAWAKRISAPWANKIVAVSEAVKKDAIKRYGLKEKAVKVIYNGVDLEKFPYTPRVSGNKKIIGSLGRLEPQKGQSILIQAAAGLKGEWQIRLAGEGSLKTKLQEEIERLKLEDKIQLIGLTDAASFLDSLDIFVFPSLWEGMGIAALEAMAVGRPIVASRIDGIAEILDDDCAWLFPAGDSRALTEALNRLMTNAKQEDVAAKVRRAHEKVGAEFSLAAAVSKYEKLYLSLIEKNYENNTGK